MTRRVATALMVLALAACGTSAQAPPPSVDQFKRALDAKLQKLKVEGVTARTVLFEQVAAGNAEGGVFRFQVTAVIHDYGPGYPPNHYYGETCVGRMDKWIFTMRQDEFGEWIVQGRMTPNDNSCKKNPSEGVSAVPVSSLPGSPAPKTTAAAAMPQPKPQAGAPSAVMLGEYACYGVGGRIMAGMGFRLKADGTYLDQDGLRGGTYTVDPLTRTIAFRNGFLGTQIGTSLGTRGFDLSKSVNCEPYK